MHNLDLKLQILMKFPSQADFAMAAGEHESKVSQVIRGRRKLSGKDATKWHKVLDCDLMILKPVTRK